MLTTESVIPDGAVTAGTVCGVVDVVVDSADVKVLNFLSSVICVPTDPVLSPHAINNETTTTNVGIVIHAIIDNDGLVIGGCDGIVCVGG